MNEILMNLSCSARLESTDLASEGPHSALNEDEFFDALEMAYQQDEMAHHGHVSTHQEQLAEVEEQEIILLESQTSTSVVPIDINHKSITGVRHRLTDLVDEKISQYACYLFESLDTSLWKVVHEEDDMKVYRRELEVNNVVVDPLRASYIVPGITAREMVKHYFDKETRLFWDGMVETVDVVETLAEDTLVFHQLQKRIWPSTQRETLFCSHMCTLTNAPCPDNMVGHTFMVGNFSLDHDKVPSTSKLIRATLNVGLVCQTVLTRPMESRKEAELTRDDINCKFIYAANVNPGGWAPAAVVRTIAKREICKFIKTFSASARKHASSTPLTL